MGWIYLLVSPSGKSYVGQTIRDPKLRFAEHRRGESNCSALRNAIQKYGWDNFSITVFECENQFLNDREEFLISVLGTLSPYGYNLKISGSNGKYSECSIEKISGGNNHRFGKKGVDHNRSKKIYQFRNGIFIKEYGSVSEAARVINGSQSHISNCALGKQKTAYGCIWSYDNDN